MLQYSHPFRNFVPEINYSSVSNVGDQNFFKPCLELNIFFPFFLFSFLRKLFILYVFLVFFIKFWSTYFFCPLFCFYRPNSIVLIPWPWMVIISNHIRASNCQKLLPLWSIMHWSILMYLTIRPSEYSKTSPIFCGPKLAYSF